MDTKTVFRIAAFAAVGSALISAQSLHVKPGQWETTTTSSQGGAGLAAALPPGALDRLPPEQRAKIEAQLKQSAQGRTTTSSHCVTPEDAAKGFQPSDLPKTCSYNVTTSTPSQQKMTVTCDTDKAKTTGTVQVDVVNADLVKGTIQMVTMINGQTVNTNMTFSSKYLGAACTENKSGK